MNRSYIIRKLFTNFIRWFTVPQSSQEMNPRNFINVQVDAVGVGLASAANPFLPVFLTRLGASTLQVGLLTTMPAVTGLLLAIPLGQFLQGKKNIVPWFSMARLTVLSGYLFTGIITFFLPETASVIGILGIWALVTIPQTVLQIAFTVVMNSIAGPSGRYELMMHRWSILGFTNAITALMVGQVLDVLPFPLNYQIVFIALSVGGLISYYFSSHLTIPEAHLPEKHPTHSIREQAGEYIRLILSEKSFVNFISKRFVFLTGTVLVAPLLPVYYVRELNAADSSISFINIAANITVILGYFFWIRQSRLHGSQIVLLSTTFGVSLFPILTGLTHTVWPIPFYAGLAGIFQAGLNLVMFDELMKRIPEDYSATFVAAAQSITYLSSIVAPLIGTWLASMIGIAPALIIGGLVSLLGFSLFFLDFYRQYRSEPAEAEVAAK